MKTLIRNGTVVTPHGACSADLLLAGGRVRAVGPNLVLDAEPPDETIDATGKIVLPGGVDAHTHITLDPDRAATGRYFSGTLPAAAGGATTIIDHLAFAPQGRDVLEQLALHASLAKGESVVDYGFHGLIQGRSEERGGPNEQGEPNKQGEPDPAALEAFVRQGASSVKFYTTYAGRLDDEALGAFLVRCGQLGVLAAVHCEDHACVENGRAACLAANTLEPEWHAKSRPPECEARSVARVLRLAAKAGDAPVYIVHLSTALGLAEIKKARAAGQKNIFVETCPQYLCLTDERYVPASEGARCIMSPPLRTRADCEALWAGLVEGDIQTVATDHCSFTLAEKAPGSADFTRCPGGAPGLEERLALLYSLGPAAGRMPLARLAEVLAANPAKLMGLYPQKGALLPGSDADVVILNPKARRVLGARDLHGPGDYSIYEGMEIRGAVEQVFLRGRPLFRGGVLAPDLRGAGRFLPRRAFMDAR